MSYQKGEIYFVRERDRKTGRHTEFVKIGLVRYKENRDSFVRLLEHQTGNPRALALTRDEIVVTEAVDLVEAQLHRRLADKRVSGEWFHLSSEREIREAIRIATELKRDVEKLLPLLERAEQLTRQESTEPLRAATPEDIALGRGLALAERRVKDCEGLLSDIRQKLVAIVDGGGDVSPVADTIVRTYRPKFLEADFKAAKPALWAEYLEDQVIWQHSFLPKTKVTSVGSADSDFSAALAQVRQAIAQYESHDDVLLLNEPQLALTKLKGEASWDADIYRARLKIAVGAAKGIDGVCSWKRAKKVTQVFNSERFAAEHPDLAKQFVSLPKTKTYVQSKKVKV